MARSRARPRAARTESLAFDSTSTGRDCAGDHHRHRTHPPRYPGAAGCTVATGTDASRDRTPPSPRRDSRQLRPDVRRRGAHIVNRESAHCDSVNHDHGSLTLDTTFKWLAAARGAAVAAYG